MRFEWVVLPQGMKNSPTLCQLYVDDALSSLRIAWPGTLIYHYMDDILIAQSEPITQKQEHQLEVTLKHRGLVVAPEKVQRISPIKYLGWKITDSHIMPQKLNLHTKIKTLHDMQTFMGEMQWLCPVVGISPDALEKLRPLLKGTNPSLPVALTSEQKAVIQEIAMQVVERKVHRRDPELPISIAVLGLDVTVFGALVQCKDRTWEPWVLEWIFQAMQPKTSILTLGGLR